MIKGRTVPYDDLDSSVVELVRAINEFPGLGTRGSCGGGEGHLAGPDHWHVTFDVQQSWRRPTKDGWLSLGFLSWVFYDLTQVSRSVELWPVARPPYMNTPGKMLYFAIEGARDEGETEPSELAETINERRLEVFTG